MQNIYNFPIRQGEEIGLAYQKTARDGVHQKRSTLKNAWIKDKR